MSNETATDDIRLHHSIAAPGQSASASEGDDFAAAFKGDDEITPAASEAAPPASPGDEGASAATATEGVDSPENGAQVPPQASEIVLDDLPENIRQSVETILEAKRTAEEALAQQQRDFEALKGRVAPVQRELDIAKRELANRTAPQAPQQRPQPQAVSTVAATQAQFETPEWKEYERLYPEDANIQKRNQLALAQQMDDRIGRLEAVFESEAQRINRLEQERMEAAKRADIDEIAARHPDWDAINQSDEFWDWFNQQPALTHSDERVLRQRLNDKNFVINTLNFYKAVNAPTTAAPPGAGTPPATTQTGVASQPDPTLALASAPRNAGAGVRRPQGGAPSAGDEFMAGFKSDD